MLTENLKIAIISHDITWADKDENIITVADLLNRIDKDTDLVILPELFTTGTINDNNMLHKLSETNSDNTMATIHRWSRHFNFAICGSFLATTGSKFYNRAFFVEPAGDEYFYDKYHLFSLSFESQSLTQGVPHSPVIRYRGWNLKMAICYDIRFPVWCRNKQNEYDVMLVPANWPDVRGYAWKQLLSCRAIENMAYTVGANRSGNDDFGTYSGASYIFDYYGNSIGVTRANDMIIYAQLNKKSLNRVRGKFPVWKDADDFSLNTI